MPATQEDQTVNTCDDTYGGQLRIARRCRKTRSSQELRDQEARVSAVNAEDMALLCTIYACDRARKEPMIDLPIPGTPEVDATFLATWEAFRHVTTELGKLRMAELGKHVSDRDPLEAFVHGRQIPAHIRWAETEAMIRAGEWSE